VGFVALACASVPQAGPVADGSNIHPRITAVDSMLPPRSAWVDLDQPGYTALLLVAPGHSATLLYPADSGFDNRLSAGTHQLTFRVPEVLVAADSARNPDRGRQRSDTSPSIRVRGRQRADTGRRQMAISPLTPTYLLLVTSPQPLVYQRIVEKTAGVSIPSLDDEALNAVAKAVKNTITVEPRDWAGFYQRIEVRRRR
jgi:hypothetical protein